MIMMMMRRIMATTKVGIVMTTIAMMIQAIMVVMLGIIAKL